ncbi:MAG: ArsC family reductase [Alcanivorax sp.]|jgi:arsenate reductase|nr:ArsC family reductase [Alcanivorax sp.]
MAITVYGIKNCDTMKKALKWLDQQGLEYHFHDYKKDGVPEAPLRRWIDALGWDTVINRRGTTWRKLDQSTRDNMDAESAVAAARDNPSLIKRPILHSDNIIEAGFEEGRWKTLLG